MQEIAGFQMIVPGFVARADTDTSTLKVTAASENPALRPLAPFEILKVAFHFGDHEMGNGERH